jgi:DNA-binding beta-propeller fold protein YncE
MVRLLAAALVLAISPMARAGSVLALEGIGDAILLPDGKTLVVSVPEKGMLHFIDTITEKEVKSVELEVKPGVMAAQKGKLFVAQPGSGRIVVFDSQTAREVGEVKLEGEPVTALACGSSKGMLYAVNSNNEVFSIDPEKLKAHKTKARGQMIAVADSDGTLVYTGIQKAIRDTILIEEGPGGVVKLSLATVGDRALMLRYKAEGAELKPTGANDNAALNGRDLAVSADGKYVAMSGGGGWKSKTDPRMNYCVAVFDGTKLNSLVCQVALGPYPHGVAFHPHLPLGVAFRDGHDNEVAVFHVKSGVKKLTKTSGLKGAPPKVLFVGEGAKVAHVARPRDGKGGGIQFIDLKLSDAEKAILGKAYPK